MFKVQESPLKLIEIVSVEHSVKTISLPEVKEINLRNSIIRIDFNKQIKHENSDFFRICLELAISPPKGQQGYKIKCKVQGYFYIEDRDEKPESSSLENSALAMVISYTRAYIKTLTYNCCWGKYILPSLDMTDVVNQKIHTLKKELEQAPE